MWGNSWQQTPAKRQEFVRLFEKKMDVEGMPSEMHQKLEQKISNEINTHVIGADKMFQDIQSGGGSNNISNIDNGSNSSSKLGGKDRTHHGHNTT